MTTGTSEADADVGRRRRERTRSTYSTPGVDNIAYPPNVTLSR
jgi:hypothetical protein